jgi:hypothetical protein
MTRRRNQTTLALRIKILDRGGEFAADGAAEAARLQHHHRLVDPLEQVMVEADFAELVDQHRRVRERGFAQ